jgi:hypothetical protein
LGSHQVMSFQEWGKKLVWRKLCLLFFANRKLLIAEYLTKGQKSDQDYFISDIFLELERETMRDKRRKQGGTFYAHVNHSKNMNVAKPKKNSIGRASHAVIIHLILLIWVHGTFGSLEWWRKKWRIANFAEFKMISAVRRRFGMNSLSKTSNLCSVSGGSA